MKKIIGAGIVIVGILLLSGCGQVAKEVSDQDDLISTTKPPTSSIPTTTNTTPTLNTVQPSILAASGITASITNDTSILLGWKNYLQGDCQGYRVIYIPPSSSEQKNATYHERISYNAPYYTIDNIALGTYQVVITTIGKNGQEVTAPTFSICVTDKIATSSYRGFSTCPGTRYDSNWTSLSFSVLFAQEVTFISWSAPYVTNVVIKLNGESLINYSGPVCLEKTINKRRFEPGTYPIAGNAICYPPENNSGFSYRAQQALYGHDYGLIYTDIVYRIFTIK